MIFNTAMAQTRKQIEAALASIGSRPRKQFGQNFMVDANLVRLIADAGEINPNDTVIEVGPGTGTLTEELLDRAGEVIAVEIDRDLAKHLRERFAERPNFRLIEGDALAGKHALNVDLHAAVRPGVSKLVANLPYNIASPLVVELLLAGVELLAFTVQKEVADRLRARAGEEAYGPLTATVNVLGRVEVLRTIAPSVFWPAPSVDSALVRIRRDDRTDGRGRPFGEFVQRLFAYRRKTLRRALAEARFTTDSLPRDVCEEMRVEVVSPESLLRMLSAARPAANEP